MCSLSIKSWKIKKPDLSRWPLQKWHRLQWFWPLSSTKLAKAPISIFCQIFSKQIYLNKDKAALCQYSILVFLGILLSLLKTISPIFYKDLKKLVCSLFVLTFFLLFDCHDSAHQTSNLRTSFQLGLLNSYRVQKIGRSIQATWLLLLFFHLRGKMHCPIRTQCCLTNQATHCLVSWIISKEIVRSYLSRY